MAVTLNLNPDVEKGLMAQAHERGVSLSDYLQEIVAREAGRLPAAVHRSGKEKARAFEQWAKGHRDTPPLPDEAVKRAILVREVL